VGGGEVRSTVSLRGQSLYGVAHINMMVQTLLVLCIVAIATISNDSHIFIDDVFCA
jgi:hypothetical protein